MSEPSVEAILSRLLCEYAAMSARYQGHPIPASVHQDFTIHVQTVLLQIEGDHESQ